MREPVIVPRERHEISRKQIDPDALKVLYRLHQNDHVAYLVGGSVRDLLLGRRPKDFDIGTSAHPYQVKRLFKNCWIIGRRFRLAHVRFGPKAIEVATFRRQLSADELAAADEPTGNAAGDAADEAADSPERPRSSAAPGQHIRNAGRGRLPSRFHNQRAVLRHRHVLDHRLHGRPPGSPGRRRALDRRPDRAPAGGSCPHAARSRHGGASRLPHRFTDRRRDRGASIRHRPQRAGASDGRVYELLRSGSAERAFRMLAERRLLEPIAPELQRGATDRLWESLAALDAYRRRFDVIPDTLTNAVLLGSLLVPLGHSFRSSPPPVSDGERRKEPRLAMGMLPLPRRDVERMRQILGLQRRLIDMGLSPRARRALMHRSPFKDALTWLEIHGQVPEVIEHWRGFVEAAASYEGDPDAVEPTPQRRRRRRRRRSVRPTTH